MTDDEYLDSLGLLPTRKPDQYAGSPARARQHRKNLAKRRRETGLKTDGSMSEDELHKRVCVWLSGAIAKPGVCSPEGAIWYSVETRARRSLAEGASNKERGCIAGVPDVDIYWQGRAYKIELKARGGVVSDEQRALHAELEKAGVKVRVCYSLEEVKAVLVNIPHRRGRGD